MVKYHSSYILFIKSSIVSTFMKRTSIWLIEGLHVSYVIVLVIFTLLWSQYNPVSLRHQAAAPRNCTTIVLDIRLRNKHRGCNSEQQGYGLWNAFIIVLVHPSTHIRLFQHCFKSWLTQIHIEATLSCAIWAGSWIYVIAASHSYICLFSTVVPYI